VYIYKWISKIALWGKRGDTSQKAHGVAAQPEVNNAMSLPASTLQMSDFNNVLPLMA